jgi:tetrapyrrole methylase family protein/MazG family protein
LRGKDGCPWDREQTLNSLKRYVIEEAYELLDAVDARDPASHREELGDVLLQVALHARIRQEEGVFDFNDVADAIADKLIRRHPHVFGDVKVADSAAVLRNWEAIKSGEKKGERRSILAGVPRHLPALQRAQRVQSRAARVGFDWPNVRGVLAKLREETAELRNALRRGNRRRISEEIGDLLFTIVNLSRFHHIEAEESLERTTAKFMRRFRAIEDQVHAAGRKLSDCSLAELDAYWDQAKKAGRRGARNKKSRQF